ncbi:MAG TPA: hypoxanthine phosphoribosyltransferase [Phycisphaerales bacterium]|nr:hypoxanthine phosphoribosyltransferase [Phycisphaerales bacterium]
MGSGGRYHPAHMVRGLGRVLIDRERIASRVREMGLQLSSELEAELARDGADPSNHADRIVLLPILAGALVFTADLIREMPLRLSMRMVTVSSYAGQATTSRGAAFRGALPQDLGGRHVVVIDDILDSGQTLALVKGLVLQQNPASLRLCVLLDKQVARKADIHANLVGFQIPDEFVVGYGLDYDGYYRNLPEIRVLEVG